MPAFFGFGFGFGDGFGFDFGVDFAAGFFAVGRAGFAAAVLTGPAGGGGFGAGFGFGSGGAVSRLRCTSVNRGWSPTM